MVILNKVNLQSLSKGLLISVFKSLINLNYGPPFNNENKLKKKNTFLTFVVFTHEKIEKQLTEFTVCGGDD